MYHPESLGSIRGAAKPPEHSTLFEIARNKSFETLVETLGSM